jgi:hypothetical protein
MLLRALENLNIGIKKGEIFKSSRLRPEIRDILIVRQKIAPVSAPPITAMSDFEAAAELLVASGIETLADVIEADEVEGLSSDDLAELKSKAEASLIVVRPCGCKKE